MLVNQQQALVEAAHQAVGAVALADEGGQGGAALIFGLAQHLVYGGGHTAHLVVVGHRHPRGRAGARHPLHIGREAVQGAHHQPGQPHHQRDAE